MGIIPTWFFIRHSRKGKGTHGRERVVPCRLLVPALGLPRIGLHGPRESSRSLKPLPPEGFLEDLCYFAQQAAEMAFKAVYQKQGWTFARTHNLGKLIDGLQQ